MKPHACPVCHGQGTVSKPPWVAGDQPEWAGTGTGSHTCHACSGSGIVWEPDPVVWTFPQASQEPKR